jgi:Tol biopolymer transport system component
VTKGKAATRWWAVGLVGIVGSLGLVACSDDESASPPTNEAPPNDPTGATGSVADDRIAFVRGDAEEGEAVTYTVNPDGSDEEQLFFDGPSEFPRWSPDGTEIQINCCDDGMIAHFVDPDTGELIRTLPQPDPSLELYCGGSWSQDGKRITCEGYGVDDPGLNGIYTVRASDGGGLQRITSTPHGGYDSPGDYSPDGERLVFLRFIDEEPVGVFVTGLDGSGLQRVSPPDVSVDSAGAWSPDGSQILFETSVSEDIRSEIWVVNADGRSPHELPITPECGGPSSDPNSFGCFDPAWSPDGTKIVFGRSNADASIRNIYIVNADGSGLVQVTDGGSDHQPHWATPADEA